MPNVMKESYMKRMEERKRRKEDPFVPGTFILKTDSKEAILRCVRRKYGTVYAASAEEILSIKVEEILGELRGMGEEARDA